MRFICTVYFAILYADSSPLFICFAQALDVKNSIALNLLVPVFAGHLHGFLLDINLEMEFLA